VSGLVWLASYPKSGNTWLRALLTNYLRDANEPADINKLVGTNASSRSHFDEWAGIDASALNAPLIGRLRPEVYRRAARDADETLFIKVHDAWGRADTGEPIFPSDVTRGIVYIVRNPLDLVASYAHHLGTSMAAAVEKMCDSGRAGAVPSSDHSSGLPDQLGQHLGSWSDHVRSWVDESPRPVHVVRYEDLSADPCGFFGGVVKFCGLDYEEERVNKAVRFSSFGNLKRQEESAGFRERSAVAPSGFFRRGETGSWRHELPGHLAERLTAAHHHTMKRFGYAH
jgi:aryl sulfotransferase